MDGTVRDFQRHTSQFTPGKNFDRSGSFGPWIVTPDEFDASTAIVSTRVNGETLQKAQIGDMIHPIAKIIAYCSSFTTLSPGDVIATGTPGGVGYARQPSLWLRPGDEVEVEVSGLGVLSNRVVAETP
jgi:2-keto-4-pentenoate hydratase/2-oxohepta-3-ene-1,7-dioic acid hydratase in catechol pathway